MADAKAPGTNSNDKEGVLLFVYGTLMRNERAHQHLSGAHFVASAHTAPCFQLLNAGSFPAMVASGAQAVVGELWRVPPDLLARIDRYEGVPHLYQRLPVQLADGTEVESYLAVPGALGDNLPAIQSGDWRDRGG